MSAPPAAGTPRPAVLSLGSNLGDREEHLRSALRLLRPTAVSSLWETDPVGGVEQGPFLNVVCTVPLDASAAWSLGQRAEAQARRTRDRRWGPRTLDVDVVVAAPPVPPGLELPHPRAHERAFVLAPWAELDPGAVLPGHGPVTALLESLGEQGVRRVGVLA